MNENDEWNVYAVERVGQRRVYMCVSRTRLLYKSPTGIPSTPIKTRLIKDKNCKGKLPGGQSIREIEIQNSTWKQRQGIFWQYGIFKKSNFFLWYEVTKQELKVNKDHWLWEWTDDWNGIERSKAGMGRRERQREREREGRKGEYDTPNMQGTSPFDKEIVDWMHDCFRYLYEFFLRASRDAPIELFKLALSRIARRTWRLDRSASFDDWGNKKKYTCWSYS